MMTEEHNERNADDEKAEPIFLGNTESHETISIEDSG